MRYYIFAFILFAILSIGCSGPTPPKPIPEFHGVVINVAMYSHGGGYEMFWKNCQDDGKIHHWHTYSINRLPILKPCEVK